MNRTEYREKIRQDFLDIGSFPTFSFEDESIDRALDSAIEDLSRLVPDRKVAEIRSTSDDQTYFYTKTAATDEFTKINVGSSIKLGTVIVTSVPTTFIQNTDYIVDHFNGIITFPVGSGIFSLTDSATVIIAYQKSRNSFSLSQIFPDFRALESVTMYNGSMAYDHEYRINTQGNIISFADQWELPDNYYLLVSYAARYSLPDDNSDGTIPNFLSEIIIKGAEANLLFARALSLELTQSLNYNDLTDLDAIFTQILTDLASGRTNLASAVTQLSQSVTYIATVLGEVATDLSLITAERILLDAALTAAISGLNSGATEVDTEVAGAITAAIAKLTAADNDLVNARTFLSSGQGFEDTEVVASIVIAEADIETTAQGYLDSGDAFINTVNIGDSPDRVFAAYADTQAKMAQVVIEGAKTRIALAESYFTSSKIYVDIADNQYQQANNLIASAETRLKLAGFWQGNASAYIEISKIRLGKISNLLEKIKLFFENATNLYLRQAEGYLKAAEGYQNNVQLQVATINAGITRATEVRASGELILNIAERIRIEANRRYQDFNSLCSSRAQTSVSRSDTARQSR